MVERSLKLWERKLQGSSGAREEASKRLQMNNKVVVGDARSRGRGLLIPALDRQHCVGGQLCLYEFILTLQSFLVLVFFELNFLHPYKEDSSSS